MRTTQWESSYHTDWPGALSRLGGSRGGLPHLREASREKGRNQGKLERETGNRGRSQAKEGCFGWEARGRTQCQGLEALLRIQGVGHLLLLEETQVMSKQCEQTSHETRKDGPRSGNSREKSGIGNFLKLLVSTVFRDCNLAPWKSLTPGAHLPQQCLPR